MINRHSISAARVALLALILGGVGPLRAADNQDTWALETNFGATAGLASPAVKNQGKSGTDAGIAIRFQNNRAWESGFGYNILSLQNGFRLRPATLFADRKVGPSDTWTTFFRFGAGISNDGNAGAFDRIVTRAGLGVRRPLTKRADIGFKTELWYSPKPSGTGEDMVLLTAGITLSLLTPRVDLDQLLIPKPVRVKFAKESNRLAKSNLRKKVRSLAKVSEFLLENPTAKIEIHGFASSKRPMGFNVSLSRQRAEALRNHLVDAWKIHSDRFVIIAHGSKSHKIPRARQTKNSAVVILVPLDPGF